MSRIGKQPVAIPAKVKVEVKGQEVFVEGPKGKLDFQLPRHTTAAVANNQVVVSRAGEGAEAKSLHGLSRSIINNMVKGGPRHLQGRRPGQEREFDPRLFSPAFICHTRSDQGDRGREYKTHH